MSKRVETVWNLRQLMADQGLFKTTELIPLLEEFGVSRSALYRRMEKFAL